jgi:hypothetical protein
LSVNPNSSDDDDDGISIFQIRKIIAGIIATGLSTVIVEIVDQFRRAGGQIRSSFVTIGSTIQDGGAAIASTLLEDVLAIPFEAIESVTASAGPLAPLVAPIAWALSAAVVGGVVWGIWRFLGWL